MVTKIKPTRIKSQNQATDGDKLGYLNQSQFKWNKGDGVIYLTQWEYEALPESKLTDDITYVIIPTPVEGETIVNIVKILHNGKQYKIQGGGTTINKFLSLWNSTTGQPISFPEATPYLYSTGDWFLVDIVADETGETNYKPNGSSYTGTASTTVETNEIAQGDVYIYDGTIWLLQNNHGTEVSFANIVGIPEDNVELADRLDSKVDKTTTANKIYGTDSSGNQTTYSPNTSAVASSIAQRTTGGVLNVGAPTADTHAATKKYVDDALAEKQNVLTAGTGIDITDNVIYSTVSSDITDVKVDGTSVVTNKVANIDLSGKQDTLTAGHNITITNNTIASVDELPVLGEVGEVLTVDGGKDTQGPCPKGFHIPTADEFGMLAVVLSYIGTPLHLPTTGKRAADGTHGGTEYVGYYMTSSAETQSSIKNPYVVDVQFWGEVGIGAAHSAASVIVSGFQLFSIRPRKDAPVLPDSSWTEEYNSGGVTVHHSGTLGLITTQRYDSDLGENVAVTIADKNLGATEVYNDGDEVTAANGGSFFQRGNNHQFPWDGVIPTITGPIDASEYGPGNYYDNENYVTEYNTDDNLPWNVPFNGNLWGGITDGTYKNTIWESPEKELPSGGTAGQVLTKTSSGTAWKNIDVGDVKIFYVDDLDDLSKGLEIIDWYESGKVPVVVFDGRIATFTEDDYTNYHLEFEAGASRWYLGTPLTTYRLKVFYGDAPNKGAMAIDDSVVIPSQTGQGGKVLTTNGYDINWGTVDSLPSQTGNAGKFLQTNGTSASWNDVNEFLTQAQYDALTPVNGITYFIYEVEN